MKKHVAGFIFFLSIVSIFAIGYAMFHTYSLPDTNVIELPEIAIDYTPTTSAIKVIQAVADPAKQSLVLDLSTDGAGESEAGIIPVVLAFYKVDENGSRFIRSEVTNVVQQRSGTRRVIAKYNFAWIAGLSKMENLYITVRPVPSDNSAAGLPFFRQDATAILIASK
ncbi:MAG: hypothetical protein HOP17_09125 [Acidobacteria bacterium]|nr:hypothetical protein [Acidobacteriota bacterium]